MVDENNQAKEAPTGKITSPSGTGEPSKAAPLNPQNLGQTK